MKIPKRSFICLTKLFHASVVEEQPIVLLVASIPASVEPPFGLVDSGAEEFKAVRQSHNFQLTGLITVPPREPLLPLALRLETSRSW